MGSNSTSVEAVKQIAYISNPGGTVGSLDYCIISPLPWALFGLRRLETCRFLYHSVARSIADADFYHLLLALLILLMVLIDELHE